MRSVEHYITRSPQLAEELAKIMTARHQSVPQVVKESGVSCRAVNLILRPCYRKGSGVYKEKCASVVEVVTPEDLEARISLLTLAGIETFFLSGSDEVPDQIVELL